MRRRLLLALLPLLTALLVALELPLVQNDAARRTQDLFITCVVDAQRFAARADETMRMLAGGGPLREELGEFRRLSGRTVTIVDREGEPALGPSRPIAPRTAAALAGALAGTTPPRPATIWPWRREPMVVAIPIGQNTNTVGAVAIEAPTSVQRAAIERRIAVLAALGIGVLLLATLLGAVPVTRWVLRPVERLGAAAARLAGGDLGARAPVRGGPPELQGLAAAFNRMSASLEAAIERQRAFVADASHELRNPLATLRLRIESLAGRLEGDDARQLELALDESDRLGRTVTRLLDLARAEATAAERVDFDLAVLTQRRLAAWLALLDEAGCDVRLPVRTQARCHGAPDAVEYALDVVLENARNYASGARVEITIAARGDRVELRVRDHGPGAAGDDVQRIGARFWRAAQHRDVPGTGLGIATARSLLESTGGTLDVAAAQPGLTVTIGLPAVRAATRDTSARLPGAAAPAASHTPSERPAGPPPGGTS